MAVARVHAGVVDKQVFDALRLAAFLEQPQGRDGLIVHLIVQGGVVLEILESLRAVNLQRPFAKGLHQHVPHSVHAIL